MTATGTTGVAAAGRLSWRKPALVMICGGLALALAMGTRQSFGIFLQPMSLDLGWEREIFAFAIALQNIVWGVAQPAVGMIADRYGSGRVIAAGGAVYVVGLYFMGASSSVLAFTLSAGFGIGLALSCTSFAVVLSAVGRAYPPERRSLALGISGAVGSFGQFAMIPVGQAFIDGIGWGGTLMVLAVACVAIMPLSAALGGRPTGEEADAGAELSFREALAQAGGHAGYRYLTAGFFVCGFQVTFVMVHLPAYLTDQGVAPRLAAFALASIGLFNIVGSLICGWLGGRFSKKHVLSLLYLSRAGITVLFLLLPLSDFSILLFAGVSGLLWLGTVPLTGGLVAQIFGPRYMATLFGIVFLSHQIGAFIGAWLGGYLYDATGSYAVVWWLYVALGLIAALLHWPIDQRRVGQVAPGTA